ncbi:hypothetical protein NE237_026439 [Protea cynaroides]|uniref:Uncharacterized protein n=1 Tax=Protea cynaroides TaxID=273540 RepID=A0A9Q0K2Q7_9MAGN|nr:hypothetical protein NE237_026439 [Protea cynaroides]
MAIMEEEQQQQMVEKESVSPHFVMMHGVGHGARCWYKNRCLLESSGHKVTCLDLKSAKIDPSDASFILTFNHYNQPLLDFIFSLPPHHQVIFTKSSSSSQFFNFHSFFK